MMDFRSLPGERLCGFVVAVDKSFDVGFEFSDGSERSA